MKYKILKYLCSIFLAVALIMMIFTYRNVNSAEVFYDYPLNGYTIVLDAGHGGEDGGAIGINTLVREKDINLSITKKIGRLFQSAGALVFFTRTDDDALSKNGFNKMEDMYSRSELIKKIKPYIVISIHCNSFPQSKSAKGAQMFYYPESVTGKMLAEYIQESLKENVDSTNKRQPKGEDFYMLRHGNSTNVMIECGFLSCPDEEKLLLDELYQDKIAYAVFDGTSKYICRVRAPENI